MDTKSKVRALSIVLFVAVFAVWVIFFVIISGYISDGTTSQITLAADQIIERLGDEFAEMEQMTLDLKQDDGVKAILQERDRRSFFSLAGEIELNEAAHYSDFINSVVLFGSDRHGYRLAGALSNNACSVLYDAVSPLTLPSHLAIELDGKKYIGYADEILPGGAAVVLAEDEKILEVVRASDQSDSLIVVIRANGETVTSNTGLDENIGGGSRPVIHSNLGVTPFEITVTADANYMNASVVSFSVVAVITAVIFAAVLFLYTGILNSRFFRPMVSVIDSIKQLQAGASNESLPHVQSAEFDNLIDKINEMLTHIETKNAEVLVAEMKAKNAEIGRQKALVFSLQRQINAHFTVNTLEAIRTAVEQGKLDKAENLMSGLTRIVRYAHSKEETVNIWDETDILKYYATIMSGRYGGKLTAEFDFDEDLMEVNMPRMLLQPLMENAVVHGFKNMDSGCMIRLKAEIIGGVIRFTVSDNGCGMSGTEMAALKERLRAAPGSLDGLNNIALLNIRNRLYYYYGNTARMDVNRSEGGGFEVTLEVPAAAAIGGAPV